MIGKDIAAIAGLVILGGYGMYSGVNAGFSTILIGLIAGIAGYHIRDQRK